MTATGQRTLANVTGLLHAFRNGQELPDSPIAPLHLATAAPLGPTSDQAALRQSLDTPGAVIEWRIPDAWATGTLDLRATVNDPGMQAVRRLQECDGCTDGANSLTARVRFQPSISQLRFDRSWSSTTRQAATAGHPLQTSWPSSTTSSGIYPVADGVVDMPNGQSGPIRTSDDDCGRSSATCSSRRSRRRARGSRSASHAGPPGHVRRAERSGQVRRRLRADGIGAAGFSALWKKGAGAGLTAPARSATCSAARTRAATTAKTPTARAVCDATSCRPMPSSAGTASTSRHERLPRDDQRRRRASARRHELRPVPLDLDDDVQGALRRAQPAQERLGRRVPCDADDPAERALGDAGRDRLPRPDVAALRPAARQPRGDRDRRPRATAQIGRAAAWTRLPSRSAAVAPTRCARSTRAARTVAEHRFDLDPVAGTARRRPSPGRPSRTPRASGR